MSFRFASASSQRYINDTSFISAVPFTIGCWVRPAEVSAIQSVWTLNASANTTHYLALWRNTATNWQLVAAAGGASAAASAGVPVNGAWTFIVCRCISATNRRIHVLQTNDGSHANAQSVTSRAPTGINVFAVGVFNGSSLSQFWDGDIAEFWVCDADIWQEGTALPESLFRNLAYRGPFCDPRTYRRLTEYYSFRVSPSRRRSSSTVRGGTEWGSEVYYGGGLSPNPSAIRIWDSLGGDNARLSQHPPGAAHGRYVKPRKRPTLILV